MRKLTIYCDFGFDWETYYKELKDPFFPEFQAKKHFNACIHEVFSLKLDEKLRMSEKRKKLKVYWGK